MSAKNSERFQRWNSTVSTQMQELRDKIAKAKHAAEGVSIPRAISTSESFLY